MGVEFFELAVGLDLLAGIPVLPLEIREKLLSANSEQGQIAADRRSQQRAGRDNKGQEKRYAAHEAM